MDYAIYNKNGLAQIELLQAGADYIERPDDDLNPLLRMAFDAEKFEAMQTLFDHGADELQTAALVVRIDQRQLLGKGKVLERLRKCRRQGSMANVPAVKDASSKGQSAPHAALHAQGRKRVASETFEGQIMKRETVSM
ncbi:hypothetical protein SLS54_009570 [Diplodia seriata]